MDNDVDDGEEAEDDVTKVGGQIVGVGTGGGGWAVGEQALEEVALGKLVVEADVLGVPVVVRPVVQIVNLSTLKLSLWIERASARM